MIIVFNFTYNSNCSKESSEEEKMKKTYKKERRSFTKELSDFQKYSDDATLYDDKFSEIVLSTPINGSYKAMEEIIRIITGTRKHVISVKPQFTVVGASLGSDVRFDFLVETDDGDLYDIEIQHYEMKDLGERLIVYNAAITLLPKTPGLGYKNYPSTHVICITDTKAYQNEKDIHRETYGENHEIICVTSHNKYENKEFMDLMHDFSCKNVSDIINPVIRDTLNYFKNEQKGVDIMKKEYDDIVAHAKPKWVEEGRKEGLKEGLKEEREDNIKKTIPVILQLGGTIQDVANIFDTTPEEIQKILDTESN